MKRILLVLSVVCFVLLVALPFFASDVKPLKITAGPEQMILRDGLQPFMFDSRRGTLVVQARVPSPPGTEFPGRWATVRSTAGGKVWKPWNPKQNQGEGPFFEGSAVQLKDGTILLLEWVARGPQPGGYFMGRLWESYDDWQTLSGPIEAKMYIPEGRGGFDDGGNPVSGVFIHRSLIEMPNGGLLATAYGWYKEDSTPSTSVKSMNKFRCLLLRSTDRGRNWSVVSTIAVDPTVGEEGFDEPVLVRLSQGKHKGRFIVLMRTGSNKTFKNNRIYQTESDDEGKTWTKPRPLDFDGVNPDLIEMQNGILVAGFGWRTFQSRRKVSPGKPRDIGRQHGNYVAFSLDQGATWTQVTQVNHEPSTCYVTVREVQPGKLFLVYDKSNGWGTKSVGYEGSIVRGIASRLIDVSRATTNDTN